MTVRFGLAAICLTLAACDVPLSTPGASGATGAGFIANLPENVIASAAPHQDLSAVTVLPEDGCYWYQHRGPVETTLLPLRTVDGRPICARAPEDTVVPVSG